MAPMMQHDLMTGVERDTGVVDRQPPRGTVTFLMTDVEGSTPAWEADTDAMGPAMARLASLIGETVAAHGGWKAVEQGEGDSAVGVFALSSAAVAAARDVQLRICAERWPVAAPLVRIALHTGDAFHRSPGHYDGPTIIRCARIRAVAHGGQVLLSDVTHSLVADRLPDGCSLAEVGTVWVKGQTRPERLWQLFHPALRSDFPAAGVAGSALEPSGERELVRGSGQRARRARWAPSPSSAGDAHRCGRLWQDAARIGGGPPCGRSNRWALVGRARRRGV